MTLTASIRSITALIKSVSEITPTGFFASSTCVTKPSQQPTANSHAKSEQFKKTDRFLPTKSSLGWYTTRSWRVTGWGGTDTRQTRGRHAADAEVARGTHHPKPTVVSSNNKLDLFKRTAFF